MFTKWATKRGPAAGELRCRAGMGFCQGALCRPRTAALPSTLQGFEVTPESDAERDGLVRVTCRQMLDYMAEHLLDD